MIVGSDPSRNRKDGSEASTCKSLEAGGIRRTDGLMVLLVVIRCIDHQRLVCTYHRANQHVRQETPLATPVAV